MKNDDPHAEYVTTLTDRGDWSELALYWMAHEYTPALTSALIVSRAQGRPPILTNWLGNFATDPNRFASEAPPESKTAGLPVHEVRTIAILSIYPLVIDWNPAPPIPSDFENLSLVDIMAKMSSQSDNDPMNIAFFYGARLKNPALSAFLLHRMGSGHLRSGAPGSADKAKSALESSQALYQELATQRPEVYTKELEMIRGELESIAS